VQESVIADLSILADRADLRFVLTVLILLLADLVVIQAPKSLYRLQ